MGNPTTYKNKPLSWENGRQLVEFDNVKFTYFSSGVRRSKTTNGITKTYHYLGETLISESTQAYDILYNYGVDGVSGFEYIDKVNNEKQTYTYRKNLQGDITAIYNSSNELVAKYIYDAWGNHKAYAVTFGQEIEVYDSLSNNPTFGCKTYVDKTNNLEDYSNHIANINPLRYRNYYFDEEINLYYLISRYYDSNTGRFITADSIEYLDPESINGLNLYCYCSNDPVNHIDSSGHFGILVTLLISTLVGMAIGGGINLGKQLVDNNWDFSKVNYWEVGAKALTGAVTGLAYGLGGVAGGIVKGSFQALTIAGKALTASQSVGLLLGTAVLTNFAAGVGGYAMHTASFKSERFNILKGISEGIGQIGKGVLSFLSGGIYVGAGIWKVGIGAKNSIYSIIGRATGKFLVNYIPNYIFDNLF